jgi:hypothetical protein
LLLHDVLICCCCVVSRVSHSALLLSSVVRPLFFLSLSLPQLGATNPADSAPGSIRGDLCVDIGRNICHGSDSAGAAEHEINFWFTQAEASDYDAENAKWVYEKP